MVLPNPRTTYKAQLLDYDALLAASDQSCSYCLTEREVQMLLAFVDYIAWKTRYINTTTEIDTDLIRTWSNNLARKLMSGCCDESLHRFTPAGVYQSSDDGGITWHDDPGGDPRNGGVAAPPLPGDPGSPKQCAAADNVRDLFEQYRDNLIAIVGATPTIIAIIAGILAFIGTVLGLSGVGVGIGVLFLTMAAEIIQIGGTGISGEITFLRLQDFRCLVYCRMDENGQLTYEAWQGLLADIADRFSGFAETFFYQTINGMGYIGVNNAGTTGAATADDCDDCDCDAEWCYEFDFLVDDGDWEIRGGAPYGTWVSGQGWVGTTAGSGVAVVASRTLSAFTITHVDYDVVFAGTGNSTIIIDNTIGIDAQTDIGSGHYSWNGTVSGTDITLNPSSGAAQGADCAMTRIKFSGTGSNPFGADNC